MKEISEVLIQGEGGVQRIIRFRSQTSAYWDFFGERVCILVKIPEKSGLGNPTWNFLVNVLFFSSIYSIYTTLKINS